jgi:hypothetical protein
VLCHSLVRSEPHLARVAASYIFRNKYAGKIAYLVNPTTKNLQHMKKLLFNLMALSLLAIGCNSETKPSEAATAITTTEKQLTPEEEMKAWMDYATPGKMHEWLAKSNGTWESEVTSWMHPDSPAVKSKAVSVNKMILGGRYQEGTFTGDMMGMPFEGRAIVGYDNAMKVFHSSWVDNMGTGVMNMEGVYDPNTKTLTSKGKMVDPGTGKELDVREVITFIDDNNQKMEMFCTKNGKETKNMEIVSKRKK